MVEGPLLHTDPMKQGTAVLQPGTISRPQSSLHRHQTIEPTTPKSIQGAHTIDRAKSTACPKLFPSKRHPSVEQQPLSDRSVLKIYKSFLGILPLVQAGAVQAPAIQPAWAELNATIRAKRSGETEYREELGRKEMARSAVVNSPSLCPALGNDVR